MEIKIAIDATAGRAGGAITYLSNLLSALANIDESNDYVVLLSSYHKNQIHFNLPSNFRIRYIDFPKPALPWRLTWQQIVLPSWLARVKVDVLLAAFDVAPIFSPCPVVLAIHNPNPYYKLHISGNRRLKFWLQKQVSWLSARRAHKALFVSGEARDAIAPQLGISLDKSRVIYHGINRKIFDPNRKFGSISMEFRMQIQELEPFVLCVSSISPHKNYETLLRSWSQIKARNRYNLVIAGGCYIPGYFDKLIALAKTLGISKEVVFLGEVNHNRMPYLYKSASAFVLPSYLETFGLPLVEAMAMHVPIVAADNTCIPEVVGDAGLFFETTDEQALAQQLTRVLTDRDLRETLTRKGRRRSEKFSWTQTAQQTFAILDEAAETNR